MSTYQDYANAASDILEKKGVNEANAIQNRGVLWGNTVSKLGEMIPQQVQQAIAQNTAKRKTAQIQGIVQKYGGDISQAAPEIMQVDPTLGTDLLGKWAKVQDSLSQVDKIKADAQERTQKLSDELLMKIPTDAATGQDAYAHWAIVAAKAGEQPPTQFDPNYVKQRQQQAQSAANALKGPIKVGKDEALVSGADPTKVLFQNMVESNPTEAAIALKAAGGDPVKAMDLLKPGQADKLVPVPGPEGKPIYGTPQAGAPVYEKPTAVAGGSDFDQYLAQVAKEKGKAPEDLTAAERLAARKTYGDAGRQVIQISPTAQLEQSNAKTVALGIKNGTTSPEVLLSSRATAQGMALQAELEKMGVDANKLTREWTATKRAIGALNSNSQVRLAEVINKASESLDKVEELNKQWSDNASRWGIKALNKAQLRLAQNGAYGPEAQSVAQRLDAQIADVTSELAQSIMGGNSPTDHAFDLAKRNLSADWTQKTLTDSIQQARYNLNLAQNARNDLLQNLGVSSTQVQVPPPTNTAPPATPKVNPFR